MNTKQRRILLIDDDVELVTLLTDYLTLEGFDAFAAHDGAEGLRRLSEKKPDLVVLDVMMPGLSGVEVLKEVRRSSTVPVLMLTARGDPIDRILGLELGADDYVPKPCPPRELVARIHAILRRTERWDAPEAPVTAGPLVISPAARTVCAEGRTIELTTTEFTLLEVLARRVGTPVPKEAIYQTVLGRPMGPSDRAIDVHISSIRHKLADALGRRVTIDNIRSVGYQLVLHTDA